MGPAATQQKMEGKYTINSLKSFASDNENVSSFLKKLKRAFLRSFFVLFGTHLSVGYAIVEIKICFETLFLYRAGNSKKSEWKRSNSSRDVWRKNTSEIKIKVNIYRDRLGYGYISHKTE